MITTFAAFQGQQYDENGDIAAKCLSRTRIVASTITAGDSEGDLVLTVPQDLADRTQELIEQTICFHKRDSIEKRFEVSITCIIQGAQNIMMNAEVGRPLYDLVLLPQHISNLDGLGPGLVQALVQLRDWARGRAPAWALTPAAAAVFTGVAFELSLRWYNDSIKIGASNTIPASNIGSQHEPTKSITACPAIVPTASQFPPACQYSRCSGDEEKKTCNVVCIICPLVPLLLIEVQGKHKSCVCANFVPAPTPDYYDTAFGDLQLLSQQTFLSMTDAPRLTATSTPGAPAALSSKYPPNDAGVFKACGRLSPVKERSRRPRCCDRDEPGRNGESV